MLRYLPKRTLIIPHIKLGSKKFNLLKNRQTWRLIDLSDITRIFLDLNKQTPKSNRKSFDVNLLPVWETGEAHEWSLSIS